MSDTVQIIIAICSCITALGVPTIALLMKMLNNKQDEAAKAVEVVKDVLVKRTDSTDKKLNDLAAAGDQQTEALKVIHTAVNSTLTAAVEAEAEAKKVAFLALKRVYEMSGKEEDKAIMEAAKLAAEKSAEAVRAKADSLQAGIAAEAKNGKRGSGGS